MYYVAVIGSKELWFGAPSDDHAQRVVSTWRRLFWRRYKASLPAWSIAASMCEGDPEPFLYRDATQIYAGGATLATAAKEGK